MLRSLGKFILAGAAAASIAAAVPAQAADDEVKIGLLFDVTGPVANFVPPMLDAAKLAVDQVNAQGGILGGKKLVTVVADTQGSPQVAVDAANKLVNAEKVAAVIGALLSGTTLASAQSVIVPAGVVQISPDGDDAGALQPQGQRLGLPRRAQRFLPGPRAGQDADGQGHHQRRADLCQQ